MLGAARDANLTLRAAARGCARLARLREAARGCARMREAARRCGPGAQPRAASSSTEQHEEQQQQQQQQQVCMYVFLFYFI